MAKNLTTRYLFKQFAQLDTEIGSEETKLLDTLVDQVSERIAKYCDRTFELTTYFAWLDGTGTPFLILPEFPIVNVWEASLTSQSAFTVKHTGSSRANVSVHGGSLHLQSTDATTGVVTDTAIVLSSFKTVTLLIAEINTKSGWTATVYGTLGNQPSEGIKPIHAQWAVDPSIAAIEVPDNVSSDDVAFNIESNQTLELESLAAWPSGTNNIFVHYKAGFTLPLDDVSGENLQTDGNVPDDLTLATNHVMKAVYDASGQTVGAMQSEKFKNYAYSMGGNGLGIIDKAIRENAASLLPHKSARVM